MFSNVPSRVAMAGALESALPEILPVTREPTYGNLEMDNRCLDANNGYLDDGYLDADAASIARQQDHSATAMRCERLRENNIATRERFAFPAASLSLGS